MLDTMISVAASIAVVLGYIAVAGATHRRVSAREELVDMAEMAAVFWPLLVVWLLVSIPAAWAWRLGAAPRLPKATAFRIGRRPR